MNTLFSVATLVSGFSDTLIWDPVTEAGNNHWLLSQSVSVERDVDLGTLAFPNAELYYVTTRSGVFWMSPTWTEDLNSLADTPPGTDVAFVMAQRRDGSSVLLMPLPSPTQRGRLFVEKGLHAGLRSDQTPQLHSSRAPTFLLAHGRDPISLITTSIAIARQHLHSFRLREEKREPAFIDCLGWCTWNAFYRDVTVEKIESGFTQFSSEGHTPGFLIIDDGWQDVSDNWELNSFETKPKSFPNGLGELCDSLRKNHDLRWIGVWLTLQGYWGGINPEGPLAIDYPLEIIPGAMEVFKGWPDQYTIESRTLIAPSHVASFFQDYFRNLADQGVNLLKVDNQAQLELFSHRSDLPENSIRDAYQNALQGAAATRMEGNLLHCMNQSSEIYFQLSSGNLARNSDDFYPKKDDDAQIKHIVQNAFNAAFTAHFCVPDWDMFQTYHRTAKFHAIARVISGGPIYISDKPELTDHHLLDQLVVGENRILRFAQPGRPLGRQFFSDPRKSAELLAVVNAHTHGFGAIALFNCDSQNARSGSFSLADLPYTQAEKAAVYDYQKDKVSYLSEGKFLEYSLPPTQAALFGIAPVKAEHACLGLSGKLNGMAAVTSTTALSDNSMLYQLNAVGDVLFAATSLPQSVTVNGIPVVPTTALAGEGFIVTCIDSDSVEIIVRY